MAFKLNFSGFTNNELYYTPDPDSSQDWVLAVNGQDLGENCLISPISGVQSFGNRKVIINNVEYTLTSDSFDITLKDCNVNIVLGDLDTSSEASSPSQSYFQVYFSYTDTSKLIIGFDGLKHFKEKQDTFNEGKFEQKTILSNVLPTDNILLDLHNYQLESPITSDFSFIMPTDASDEYLSEISFTTGSTLVAFTTTSTITFTGEDCSNTHTFVPDTNKHYSIIFWKDKGGFQAVVRGY